MRFATHHVTGGLSVVGSTGVLGSSEWPRSPEIFENVGSAFQAVNLIAIAHRRKQLTMKVSAHRRVHPTLARMISAHSRMGHCWLCSLHRRGSGALRP